MVLLITGASHTGKTLLAQRLLQTYRYPCLSMDLLKMGLIRSGNTRLTPEDDRELESYLWPIVREIIKTAIENRQDLIVEGCYVPPRWSQDFTPSYLREIRFCCLVMTKAYIETHFADIQKYACAAERRIDDSTCTKETLLLDNAHYQQMCETGVSLYSDRSGVRGGISPCEKTIPALSAGIVFSTYSTLLGSASGLRSLRGSGLLRLGLLDGLVLLLLLGGSHGEDGVSRAEPCAELAPTRLS